jgi:cytochrome oxidase Cu insertion factor (SCO1/SenC/PrrC family)
MAKNIVGLVATFGCLLLLVSCSKQAPTTTSATPPALVGTELDARVPTALSQLPLINSAGQHVTLGSFKGRLVVVSDLLTLCQETCAIGTASMLQAARTVDRAGLGSKVEFLSITIDPRRDDTRHLAAYQKLFGRLPNWELLTGSAADVRQLWDTLGVWRHTVSVSPPYPHDWLTGRPLTFDIQHSDDLIFIDAHEHFRFEIDGPGTVPGTADIPARIYAFMDALGHRNVTNPSPGGWSAGQVVKVLRWLLDVGAP